MTRILCCVVFLAFGYSSALAASKYEESIKELAEGVAAEAIKMKKSRLAVLDFVDSKGDVTPIGQFLAGKIGSLMSVPAEIQNDAVASLPYYTVILNKVALGSIGVGVLLWITVPLVKKWMKDIH